MGRLRLMWFMSCSLGLSLSFLRFPCPSRGLLFSSWATGSLCIVTAAREKRRPETPTHTDLTHTGREEEEGLIEGGDTARHSYNG